MLPTIYDCCWSHIYFEGVDNQPRFLKNVCDTFNNILSVECKKTAKQSYIQIGRFTGRAFSKASQTKENLKAKDD